MTPHSIFRRLPCNHLLHKHCIDHWLCSKDASCPFCRRTFYHLRKPIVVWKSTSSSSAAVPVHEEDKDELHMGRAALMLWLKGILCLV